MSKRREKQYTSSAPDNWIIKDSSKTDRITVIKAINELIKKHEKRTTLKIDKVLLKKKLERLYFGKWFFFFIIVSGTKYSTWDCTYAFVY